MDADVAMDAGAFAQLVRPLLDGSADLVVPRYEFDTGHCSWIGRQMAETRLSLPFARTSTFQMVVGLSEAGLPRCPHLPQSHFAQGPRAAMVLGSQLDASLPQ